MGSPGAVAGVNGVDEGGQAGLGLMLRARISGAGSEPHAPLCSARDLRPYAQDYLDLFSFRADPHEFGSFIGVILCGRFWFLSVSSQPESTSLSLWTLPLHPRSTHLLAGPVMCQPGPEMGGGLYTRGKSGRLQS